MFPFGVLIPKLFQLVNTYVSHTEQLKAQLHSKYRVAPVAWSYRLTFSTIIAVVCPLDR